MKPGKKLNSLFQKHLKINCKNRRMAALINALDTFTPCRVGENGHIELGWSNEIKEKIVQFEFQCVRCDATGVSNLAKVLDGLLSTLSTQSGPERNELLTTLYKIIGFTRDINGGKGEYSLAYMMIWIWYKYFPDLAKSALQLFVVDPREIDETHLTQEPYGSWKDIKYFCKYVLDNGGNMSHPLIKFCISGINTTLHIDESKTSCEKLTLVAKWVPREESGKFGFLFEALATNYFPQYLASAKTDASKEKALKKCKTQYRMLCSRLNKRLDTVQIKQTGKAWSAIDHSKTTSITLAKQRKAFLNQKGKDGETRTDDPDRVQCAYNLRAYMESLKREGKELKGKNVGLEMFTSQALSMFDYTYSRARNQEEADILNSQWRDNCNKKNADGLGPIIAMVDTSGSMIGDPMNAAIALGCRVAEKSCLGPRVMTFSAEPAWINLDGKETFTEMVAAIMKECATAGTNTNFYKALDLILTVIEERRIPPLDVENMILAIFSDMQIDDNLHMMNGAHNYGPNASQKTAARAKWATMFVQIDTKYAEVGVRMYGKPLKPPHILFWNLRSTSGFPCMSTEAGCSMMSGYDPTVLNMFCEQGLSALKDLTPYKNLLKKLDNERYVPLETIICRSFT